jgi:hypothetical protein
LTIDKRDQAMVGDGHAMSVTPQILEHMVGATEACFGIDDPVFSKQWAEPSSEGFGLHE